MVSRQKVVTDFTMTLAYDGLLLFANDGDIRDFNMSIGGFTWKPELVFDLSDDEAVMTDCHIAQEPNV